MDKLPMIARLLLGVVLLVFGLNKFFGFIPPMEMPEAAQAFLGALAATGYFIKVLALVEIAVGASMLTNKFVPLALVVLAPLSVHALLFHLFLDISNIIPALIVTGLNIYLAYRNRASYSELLKA